MISRMKKISEPSVEEGCDARASKSLTLKLVCALISVFAIGCCDGDQSNLQHSPSSDDVKPEKKEIENCRHLHKLVDLNDLLKQLHDNLDSTCILDLDGKTLERIWGVEISGVTPYRRVRKSRDGSSVDNFYGKPLGDALSRFYISRNDNDKEGFLTISMTGDFEASGGEFFPGGKLPDFLREYEEFRIVGNSPSHSSGLPLHVPRNRVAPNSDLKYYTLYIWQLPRSGVWLELFTIPKANTIRYSTNQPNVELGRAVKPGEE